MQKEEKKWDRASSRKFETYARMGQNDGWRCMDARRQRRRRRRVWSKDRRTKKNMGKGYLLHAGVTLPWRY